MPIDTNAVQPADQSIDQLTVNTIRDLVDGRGAGGELRAPGHADGAGPGGLHAVAAVPAVRPELPVWANRDRFVLSAGHASTLLYALLHLAGVQVGQPGLRDGRRAGGDAGRPAPVPPARLQVPRAPRVPVDLRGGVHHRPAGHRASPPASAWPSPGCGRPPRSTGRASTCSTTTSTPLAGDGCLMEGIGAEAASLAGHLQAGQPVLDLRQQPDHHRGRHQPGVQRGRAGPLRRLRLGGAARHRRQRPGRAARRVRGVQGARPIARR